MPRDTYEHPNDEFIKARLGEIMDLGEEAWEHTLQLLANRFMQKHLVETRILRGETREQVAERMGVSLKRLTKLETERWPNPYISTLARWARALDMKIQFSVDKIIREDYDEDVCDDADSGR